MHNLELNLKVITTLIFTEHFLVQGVIHESEITNKGEHVTERTAQNITIHTMKLLGQTLDSIFL